MAKQQTMPELALVKDLMTKPVFTISSVASLQEARGLMEQHHVSQLAVVDDRNRPTGFISKRDMARFLLEDTSSRRLGEIAVSEAKTGAMPSLKPDLPVLNAGRFFDNENLTYTIVANDEPLLGIMTETDLCRYYSRTAAYRFRVSDFMSRDFIFAKSTYPILHVANAIIFRQPAVPVIDDKLVGILTLSDLLSIRDKAAGTEPALITTKDLMTKTPVTIEEEADLALAAQVMIGKVVSSLPVVENESNVVGLVAKHDIVRALGRIGSAMPPEA